MKIGFVTHWFDPEGGAAAGPGTIARALRDLGHDVQVVTGFPIYPAGRVFAGYKNRPYQREDRDGIVVHRTLIYPSHDDRAIPRVANYLSFVASGVVASTRVLRDCDVVYVYSTPATVGVIGRVLRGLRGTPYVLHIQDLWPQTVTSSGFLEGGAAGRAERILHMMCDWIYRSAAHIAVISPGMVDLVGQRGIPAYRISVIPNWADEDAFRPDEPGPELLAEVGDRAECTIMYAGNLGEMQHLDTLLDAAVLVSDDERIQVLVVGGGIRAEHLRGRVQAEGLTNVRFLGPQPFSRMSHVLALGDVQLVSLKDVPLYRVTIPSKLQANMAAGRPILGALSGDGAAAIEESGAGVVTAPGDAAALADAMRRFADMTATQRYSLGQKARAYYLATYSQAKTAGLLEACLQAAREVPRG